MPRGSHSRISICGDAALVSLTRGFVATIDLADIPLVENKKWFALVYRTGDAYAVCHKPGTRSTQIKMHRLILGVPSGVLGDHVNGDTLDNRRANLRPATQAQNKRNRCRSRNNTSGAPGVYWETGKRRWVACISVVGVAKKIGRFREFDAACAARASAEKNVYGEFARTA